MNIEIDSRSGFCHGVTTAIKKAETELQGKERLYCLGDIVHNDREVERLRLAGLATIEHNSFSQLHDAKVLLRAHGEPPATYALAAQNRITLVDATCPVVLQLQKRVKNVYAQMPEAQIVIFGKRGHAEVIGLVGQTEGHALVIQSVEEAARLDFSRDIYLFSQTTMSLDGFHQVIDYITGPFPLCRHHLPPSGQSIAQYSQFCSSARCYHFREWLEEFQWQNAIQCLSASQSPLLYRRQSCGH